MPPRQRINNTYANRRGNGQFKDWTNIGKSIKADSAHKAKNHPKKPGFGNQGDY